MPPLKVLISVYACEPEKGSESGVGWNSVCQAARFHEVWVLTRAKNRGSIEASLVIHPIPKIHWIFFDPPGWARLWREERGHYYYCLWQFGAYLVAKNLSKQIGFDLVHHATLVNYWMPSFLAFLPIPFLWGPVGGGESAPGSFWPSFSLRGKAYELLRDLARSLNQLNPFVRATARRAVLGLATTTQTEERLRALGCRKVSIYSEAGLRPEEINWLGKFPIRESAPFRLVSICDLLHLKGFEFGLQAFVRFQSRFPSTEYWIIGDGPERMRLEKLTYTQGVAGKVRFFGMIPRPDVLKTLADCDVLVQPSLHDSGGWVCLEAMAAGRPVICLDLGGPALQVAKETGIKIQVLSPSQAVADLSTAMEELARDPVHRARLGQAGRKRVQRLFNWEEKGEHLASLYAELVGTKPQETPQVVQL